MNNYRGCFTKVNTAKKRTNSSTLWLQRQLNDPYVIRAKLEGLKSRAAYKLIEIHQKFHLFKPGYNVVDLGAAPGGWSQVSAELIKSNMIGAKNKVVAIDMLPMDSIPGVININKDFHDPSSCSIIEAALDQNLTDVVLSDMAANTTGHSPTDHLRIIELCESAFLFAVKILKTHGHFVAKIFQGGTENYLLNNIKKSFKKVKHFKPNSSRKESTETYLVALDYRGKSNSN